MTTQTNQPLSHYTNEALRLLGQHIKSTRIQHHITMQNLAERAGISRGLLRRIERGDPNCSIGSVFEVACLLGIKLFDADLATLQTYNQTPQEKLTLLPNHVRNDPVEVDDDF